MKKLFLSLSVMLCLDAQHAASQDGGALCLGFGFGLDYGGIGTRFTYTPIERVGLFSAVGFNFNSIGYNFGAQLRFPTEKKLDWLFTGMYGYNSVLVVEGSTTSKTTYYGPTIGSGLEWKFKRNSSSISFEILMPFFANEFYETVDALKQMGYDVSDPNPVLFSFGYHVRLNK